MSIDDVKNGQRISCNGVNGTVIGKRRTRKRRLVLVKMDNGFTLKLNAQTLLVELSEETSRTSRQLEAMANGKQPTPSRDSDGAFFAHGLTATDNIVSGGTIKEDIGGGTLRNVR